MNRLLPAVILFFLAGCTCKVPGVAAHKAEAWCTYVNLYRHPLEVRLSHPGSPPEERVLVVYATGDGGWRGLDEELFDWISAWGYPVAGFSSKGYLKNLGYISETTTPRRLVRDFKQIIDSAERTLELPQDTPIILVGLSRGAGLVVVAAGQGELMQHLAGVVAIALTKEEEHVVHHRLRRRSRSVGAGKPELVEIKTYQYLPRLAGFPVAVIQSTNDGYLPAEAARKLFGPDTDLRKFLPVQARNHRFSGGCAALYQDTMDSLAWVQAKLAQRLNSLTH